MNTTHTNSRNRLLAALPADVHDRLRPHLSLVSLPLGEVLYESGDIENSVYFPTDSIVSLVYELADGASSELSAVGNEGIVGIPAFTGGESTTSRAVVLSAGHAYRLPGKRLMQEFNRHGALLDLMLRYIQALMTQIAQTAVCNRHHTVLERLCRWLLLSLDRLPGNQLAMTQELIATMLGVRREGINEAASKLQKLGIIECRRGLITVLSRPQLEKLCCECYSVEKRESDRLLACHERPRHEFRHRSIVAAQDFGTTRGVRPSFPYNPA